VTSTGFHQWQGPQLCYDPKDGSWGPRPGPCPPGEDPITFPTIPFPRKTITYAVSGAQTLWDDVWGGIKGVWHTEAQGLQSGADITWDTLNATVDVASKWFMTGWTTYVSGIAEEVTDLTNAVIDFSDNIWYYAVESTAMLENLIAQAYLDFRAELSYVTQGLENTVTDTEHRLQTQIDALPHIMQQWSIDHIFQPLEENILRTAQQIYDTITWDVTALQGQITHLDTVVVPALLTALAAVSTNVDKLQAWQDECGDPMCATYGPKTDLTKLLKSLQALLGLLAGVGLADLTESDLERIAGYFSAITTNDVEGFVNAFAGAGATLGSASGAVVSDLGHIAAETFATVSGL
jgi:hypothetical protein